MAHVCRGIKHRDTRACMHIPSAQCMRVDVDASVSGPEHVVVCAGGSHCEPGLILAVAPDHTRGPSFLHDSRTSHARLAHISRTSRAHLTHISRTSHAPLTQPWALQHMCAQNTLRMRACVTPCASVYPYPSANDSIFLNNTAPLTLFKENRITRARCGTPACSLRCSM